MSAAESEISTAAELTERSELFSRLYRDHNRSLMRFLVSRLGSTQEALDVAQDSYVRLLQLRQPGAIGLLRSYLFKTAGNLAIDRARRRIVRDRTSAQLVDAVPEHPTTEHLVMARQELDLVRVAIASLAPKTREAFVMRVIEGVPTQQIARHMGIKERMVREHVSRAFARCKRLCDSGTGC